MELFESTVAEVVRWLLWVAHATDRLDSATEITVGLVKKQIDYRGREPRGAKQECGKEGIFRLTVERLGLC